ncbi:aminopeptidase [Aquimarina spinulae]|uniref:aminopeptidase n=1 Tax=Aquimarina spinulae TaxID=1192023 RepID=UPI000D55D2FE|nr:aminopeptidase [Aquimarina spinulae]
MNSSILKKYADLLVHYSLDIQPGDKLFIQTTTLAEPLVREVFRTAIKAGAHVEYQLEFSEAHKIKIDNSEEKQLNQPPVLYAHAMEHFDAYLKIMAPHNLIENQNIDTQKQRKHKETLKPITEHYYKRTANGSLKRTLCLYPTQAGAQMAGMSLEEYSHFVFNACHLFNEDPKTSWLHIRKEQQNIVDYLNKVDKVQYITKGTDIQFSVKGRKWINSDGRTNMPSGEVFTGPIEDSVNGTVYFSLPSVFEGHIVKGITLRVKDGKIIDWKAEEGQELLDDIFKVPGANYFGEVAIGTNYNIQQATKNILFDEKIGGTIHMAVGQSYFQTGAKNKSIIHWDMITDMTQGGQILADGKLIYENGKFLI